MTRTPLVLASASPRRQDLLERMGVAFTVAPSDVDETRRPAEPPVAYARRLAEAKARAAAHGRPDGIILAADTIVVLDDAVLGKPVDAHEAVRFLQRLRGRAHEVVTAVALFDVGRDRLDLGHASTRVWIRTLSDTEIAAYVATGDPLDKAGAYAVQNAAFRLVARIEGSETNVIGLPLKLVRELLNAAGLDATGLDAAGLDAAGLDATGLDAAGLDAAGLDAAGLDAAGLDAAGLDATGLDATGL